MATPHIDDTIVQGASYSLELTFTADDGTEMQNLNASNFRAYLKNLPTDSTYVQAFTIAISGSNNEILTLSLAKEITANLNEGVLYWDLFKHDTGDLYMVGRMEVIQLISDGTAAYGW